MISLIITSIIGLILFLINKYLFISNDSRIWSFWCMMLSIIPICGAVAYLITIILNCYYCQHLYEHHMTKYGDDYAVVRDTKLNRWLFNDIDWEEYDLLNKEIQ